MADDSARVFHELTRPEDADAAPEAIELVRAWVIDKRLQCSLNAGAFPDAAQWGVFLSDLAHHIASGIEQTGGGDGVETLKAILKSFHETMFEAGEAGAGGEVGAGDGA